VVLAAATAGHHASPVALALAVLAALAVYAAVCLVSPTRRCPKCHGQRVIVKAGKRPKPCERCRRTGGRVPRIGAATIHRWLWSVLGDGLMERRRASMREDD
jgi:hypothetical protein